MKSSRDGLCWRLGMPWSHLSAVMQERIDAVIAEHPEENDAFPYLRLGGEKWEAAERLARMILESETTECSECGCDLAHDCHESMRAEAKRVLGEK